MPMEPNGPPSSTRYPDDMYDRFAVDSMLATNTAVKVENLPFFELLLLLLFLVLK